MNCISFSFLYQKEKQTRARALKIQNENLLNMKMVVNPCIESIIQKIYFLKDENCIFLFFKFYSMNLNFIFRFFSFNTNFNCNLSFNKKWKKIWICGCWLGRQRVFVRLVDVCFVLCLILFNDFYFEGWLFDKQDGLRWKRARNWNVSKVSTWL